MSLSTIRLTTLVAVACIGAALHPSSLAAQQRSDATGDVPAASPAATTASPVTNAPLPIGPRNALAGIDTRAATDSAGLALPPQQGAHMGAGTNLALMGVGAAAIIVGLMIGGDGGTIVAISGGVLGLVGLFRYIR